MRWSAAITEQIMGPQAIFGHLRDLGEHAAFRRDDDLAVAARYGLAYAIVLSTPDEEHLVRVPEDVITPNVPNERSTIRKRHLEL